MKTNCDIMEPYKFTQKSINSNENYCTEEQRMKSKLNANVQKASTKTTYFLLKIKGRSLIRSGFFVHPESEKNEPLEKGLCQGLNESLKKFTNHSELVNYFKKSGSS